MKVYFSGICGTGLGALALFAKQAGYEVCGSDMAKGAVYDELEAAGIPVVIGPQDGAAILAANKLGRIDWLVRSSAVPETAPEIFVAKELGIRVSKRDEFIAEMVEKLGLKMVAVAGTHGKTTTTAGIIWAALNLGMPISYLVGTTLGFAGAGKYTPGSSYLVYEADEYDRNFLQYHPWLAVIPSVSYDHPDIYPTQADYLAAFDQFRAQSVSVIENEETMPQITVTGEARQYDLTLSLLAMTRMMTDAGMHVDAEALIAKLNEFPGVGRRFEKICDGVYSDYAHHPEEIAATMEMAEAECKRLEKAGVVVVYEPHQNSRQHMVKDGYHAVFEGAAKIFWLPTYLVREDPALAVISPEEFIRGLSNAGSAEAEAAKLDGVLAEKLKEYRTKNYMILLMSAGPADGWLRKLFNQSSQ